MLFPDESQRKALDRRFSIASVELRKNTRYPPSVPHLASLVRGFPVDVELKVLVLVHEAPPRLEDGKVAGILLGEQVRVVAVRQLRLDLDGLEADLD